MWSRLIGRLRIYSKIVIIYRKDKEAEEKRDFNSAFFVLLYLIEKKYCLNISIVLRKELTDRTITNIVVLERNTIDKEGEKWKKEIYWKN